ncbi:hypothetical protein QA640_37095 [Bradyrhizobium sp. CB82]|uniref:hypothetical protein n=1 Tax=Bradyrhizobium sp. CB82 TaxID=3039159 RepID=UPI0024B19A4E|nr:hypothetical protein [Bradyrhizobium sp. CB82]WFU39895.1 hypothetical protein QA640_37095 [Bradyrhizobium sp. CB82]
MISINRVDRFAPKGTMCLGEELDGNHSVLTIGTANGPYSLPKVGSAIAMYFKGRVFAEFGSLPVMHPLAVVIRDDQLAIESGRTHIRYQAYRYQTAGARHHRADLRSAA